MDDYLKHLYELQVREQRSYDRALLTLASGAIILSITYLGQLSEPRYYHVLCCAWGCWTFSLILLLSSSLFSVHALRRGIKELRADKTPTGGKWARLIMPVNWFAGAFFVAGVATVMCFAALNEGGKKDGEPETRDQAITAARATTSSPKTGEAWSPISNTATFAASTATAAKGE